MSASAPSGPKGPTHRPFPDASVEATEPVGAPAAPTVDPAEIVTDAPLSGAITPAATGGSGSRMLQQALADAEDRLGALGERADALMDVLANAGFSGASIRRHLKSIVRIAEQRGAAAQVRLRHRRLVRTEGFDALIPAGVVRRIVVRGADRQALGDQATSTNPTTRFLDGVFLQSGE